MMLANIKDVLARCGCNFDVWFSERTLHETDASGATAVTAAFDKLRGAGKLFEKDGALWFRTTDYGDDKDRVLMKSNGWCGTPISPQTSPTIPTSSTVGSIRLIDIWGADHHGYVPRMQASVSAMGHEGQFERPARPAGELAAAAAFPCV